MGTLIDRVALAQAKEGVPQRLQDFLDNFFLTCEEYEPAANYVNYVRDLDSYGRSSRVYREHRDMLLAAFSMITGYRPDE